MGIVKLSKEDKDRKAEYAGELRERWQAVEDAKGEVEEAVAEVNRLITHYNDHVSDVNEWVEEITGAMQETFDERSEKWQEGEKGQEFQGWIDEWQNFEAEEMEEMAVELPDEPAAADDLEGLQEEPS